MTRIEDILRLLHEFEGISRKYVLPAIIGKLRSASFNGTQEHGLGEDSAAISTASDDVVLLTTDGIVEELCLNHPRAAGFNAVLATMMDIYAAGGTPTSFAVALSYSDEEIGDQILEGLIDGSQSFRVPIVRGHTNPQSRLTYVVGSATGTVRKSSLLTSGGAESGDALVLLFDKVGQRGSSYKLGWDSVTGQSAEHIVKRLSVMNELAGEHLLTASKDISVAGMIGTAGMMLEYSGRGGMIDLDAVDASRPQTIDLNDWIRMYISLGFLVASPSARVDHIIEIAKAHDMTAVKIGLVDDSTSLRLRLASEEAIMFDYSKGPVLIPKVETRKPPSPS
ncbi:MAG: AIR synthase related protein [Candidatus Thorarchaeota archaeon]